MRPAQRPLAADFFGLPEPLPLNQESAEDISRVTLMNRQVSIPATVSVCVSSVLSLFSLAALLLLCVIRKKRRMEGNYRPSAEERKQTGATASEKHGLPLPLPKEERLI